VITLLNELMEGATAGDPMNQQKWSRKDTRQISSEMRNQGVDICANTVAMLLRDQDYSLRVNRKSIGETQHPDRSEQFEIIAQMKKAFQDGGQPILSVDTKKKELVGNFKNAGTTWCRNNDQVLVHDFRSEATAIAAPFGMYEPTLNRGTVVIGLSAETGEFAVDAIEQWLNAFGWSGYSGLRKLLIFCDGGGANNCRARLWKYRLYHQISQVYGIQVTVCHYPSGASKWNPVEHRLFSFISMQWAGIPLRTVDIMLNCIRSTTTSTGLTVEAFLNTKSYAKGISISDNQMKEINLFRHDKLPNWNYTIRPN
jgi:hypothetical protein